MLHQIAPNLVSKVQLRSLPNFSDAPSQRSKKCAALLNIYLRCDLCDLLQPAVPGSNRKGIIRTW